MVITDLLVPASTGPPGPSPRRPPCSWCRRSGSGTDTGVRQLLACIASATSAILVADGLNSTARWTRGLSRDSADGLGTATPVVWRAAGCWRVPAVIAAVVLAVALPTLVLPGFGLGSGAGGNGPLQLTDPTLDLRRNLNQPSDHEVINYRPTARAGSTSGWPRCRSSASAGWANVQIRLNEGSTLPGDPRADGRAGRRCGRPTITVHRLRLAVPAAAVRAPLASTADGDWRYDPNSLIVVNRSSRPGDLRNLTYSVESVDIAPDPAGLDQAGAGHPDRRRRHRRRSPTTCPHGIVELTEKVTADAEHARRRRRPRSRPTCAATSSPTAPSRCPAAATRRWRTSCCGDKKGYCEQFAAAMAMMARVAGIPSRVSVGFLPGSARRRHLAGLHPRHARLARALLRRLRLGALRAHPGQRHRRGPGVDGPASTRPSPRRRPPVPPPSRQPTTSHPECRAHDGTLEPTRRRRQRGGLPLGPDAAGQSSVGCWCC